MKIAIIAPSPVPFTIGGAEKLWWGLLAHLNQHTNHSVELIKLPSPEASFWDLIDSYKTFSRLNLNYFDLVISTKYPAWMVDHPNHYCYLQHKLRGLYDTYPAHLPTVCTYAHKELAALKRLLENSRQDRAELEPLFTELERLKNLDLPPDIFAFPGPLTRKIIHCLDNIALSPLYIRKYAAISHNVMTRTDYFPPDEKIQVIHHPSDLAQYRNTGYHYIFTVSRLIHAKRIDLLIKAMRYVKADIEFRIAGSGPERETLQRLAKKDSRIKFLGRITDQEIIEQYAGALFVPFIPYDEDYGLITIEAMQSGKAVLTTQDAGGVNEFVDHGDNGLIAAATPEALGQAMQQLIDEKEKTIAMGEKARHKVSPISWQNTCDALLMPPSRKWPRIVVTVTFPVYPPRSGGQARVYNLYKQLAKKARITLITLASVNDNKPFNAMIAPNLQEIRIPRPDKYRHLENKLNARLKASVEDIAFMLYHAAIPDYQQQLRQHCNAADIVIVSHPYSFPALRAVYQGSLWYEAHNVELDMKEAVLGKSASAKEFLRHVHRVEAQCCRESAFILTCSQQDQQRLQTLYELQNPAFILAANGVDTSTIPFISAETKQRTRQQLCLQDRHIALFIASWHQPNIEAMAAINRMAEKTPDIDYFIIGSLCHHPVMNGSPKNIYPFGEVSEEVKQIILACADVALNPISSGSGTNLKLIEYAAAGIPIITTSFGRRGLSYQPGEHICEAKIQQFPQAIRTLCAKSEDKRLNMTQKARLLTEKEYDWSITAEQIWRHGLEKWSEQESPAKLREKV